MQLVLQRFSQNETKDHAFSQPGRFSGTDLGTRPFAPTVSWHARFIGLKPSFARRL